MDTIGDIFRDEKWTGDENSENITPFGLSSKVFRKICRDIQTIFNYYEANSGEDLQSLISNKDPQNTPDAHIMRLETLVARQFIIRHGVMIMDPRALSATLYGAPNKTLGTGERVNILSANIFPNTKYIESFMGYFPVAMNISWEDMHIDVVITHFSRPMPAICERYRQDLEKGLQEWAEYQNSRIDTVNPHGVNLVGFGTSVEVQWHNPDKYFGIDVEDYRDRRGVRALFYTMREHLGCQVEDLPKLENTIELAGKHDSADRIFRKTVQLPEL